MSYYWTQNEIVKNGGPFTFLDNKTILPVSKCYEIFFLSRHYIDPIFLKVWNLTSHYSLGKQWLEVWKKLGIFWKFSIFSSLSFLTAHNSSLNYYWFTESLPLRYYCPITENKLQIGLLLKKWERFFVDM